MYRKITLGLIIMSGGCQTMPHHSNTIFFGTSTTVGLGIKVDASTTPSLHIGYDRNEAVILPLLANKKFDAKNRAIPCDQPLKDCMFIGSSGQEEDTYSILGTFGADIKGNGSGTGVGGAVGIAQYFATGRAAIALARYGGAAVVSTGPAAKASAIKGESNKVITQRDHDYLELHKLVSSEISDAELLKKMKSIDKDAYGGGTKLASACSTKAKCTLYLIINENSLMDEVSAILSAYKKGDT